MVGPICVGIVGAGGAARAIATSFTSVPDVSVAGVWSRTREHAVALAEQPVATGASVYDNWETLIERGDLDVLVIATPVVLRLEPVRLALQHGIHVLTEKSFAFDATEARAMAALAAQSNCVCAVSFNWRYSPGSVTAWHAVQEGQIGRVVDFSFEWRLNLADRGTTAVAMRKQSPFLFQRATGGGALRAGGSRDFDRIHFLAGASMTAVAGRLRGWVLPGGEETDVDGSYWLLAELSNGATGTFVLSLTEGHTERRLVLCGERGSIVATENEALCQRTGEETLKPLPVRQEDVRDPNVPLSLYGRARLAADFIAAVRRGDPGHHLEPLLPTFEDGLHSQACIDAVEVAHAEQRWVQIADFIEAPRK